LLIVVLAGVCSGATTLEGYSEFFGELNGESRNWRFQTPQFLGELRLRSSPWPNTGLYLKTQAYSNRWDNEKWENFLMLREVDLKFRGSKIEGHLFFGQDQFWLNEPLLNIVSNDIVKDDDYGPKAQGIRVDFWNVWGIVGAAFYSDKSTSYPASWWPLFPAGPPYAKGDVISSDDYRGARLKRSFTRNRVTLGGTYGRKEYGAGRDDFDETMAVDLEVAAGEIVEPLGSLGRLTLIGELGGNFSGWLKPDEKPIAWKAEIRDVGIGPLTLIANLYDIDDDFYTIGLARGDIWDDNDYHGHYLQMDFRVPRKEINLKVWRYRDKPHTFTTDRQPREETGVNAWVRFVRNFTGVIEYKRHINKDGTWPNLFLEISGENRLVRIRAQYRIKDMDTQYEIQAYGFEANANLTDDWKLYARALTVDEKTEARETVFAQVQYTGWSSAEFFLEFGDSGASWDLVRSDDFVNHDSSDVTVRVFKAFMRLYY
jgi:hypothetical protein